VSDKLLQRIGRQVFVLVDLHIIANNLRLLKNACRNQLTGVVGVVKGNAYGHGVVPVTRYLMAAGVVDRLAVANVAEAIQLRKAGISGIIHILGNVQAWEMPQCLRYSLVPTVASERSIRGMAEAMKVYHRRKVNPQQLVCNGTEYKETSDDINRTNSCNVIKSQEHNSVSCILPSQGCGHAIPKKNLHEAINEHGQCDILEQLTQCDVISHTTSPQLSSSNVVQSHFKARDAVHQQMLCNGSQKQKTNATVSGGSTVPPLGTLHIKVDTGMSRNGCQTSELPHLVKLCKTLGVPLEGIFSHISNHEDPEYSKMQLDKFEACISTFRNEGYIFHIANSGAILYDIGTDMDLVRPGISAFGMPCGKI